MVRDTREVLRKGKLFSDFIKKHQVKEEVTGKPQFKEGKMATIEENTPVSMEEPVVEVGEMVEKVEKSREEVSVTQTEPVEKVGDVVSEVKSESPKDVRKRIKSYALKHLPDIEKIFRKRGNKPARIKTIRSELRKKKSESTIRGWFEELERVGKMEKLEESRKMWWRLTDKSPFIIGKTSINHDDRLLHALNMNWETLKMGLVRGGVGWKNASSITVKISKGYVMKLLNRSSELGLTERRKVRKVSYRITDVGLRYDPRKGFLNMGENRAKFLNSLDQREDGLKAQLEQSRKNMKNEEYNIKVLQKKIEEVRRMKYEAWNNREVSIV